jgi:hypothetical protein
VSGGPERDRSGGPQWFNDGKHSGKVAAKGAEEVEVSLHGGGAPFIAGGGGWQRLRELRPGRWQR